MKRAGVFSIFTNSKLTLGGECITMRNKVNITIKDRKMETQYYTVVEKQDFFEIIENKYGELAIFIDARDGSPVNPVLEFDGKKRRC